MMNYLQTTVKFTQSLNSPVEKYRLVFRLNTKIKKIIILTRVNIVYSNNKEKLKIITPVRNRESFQQTDNYSTKL